MEHAPNRGFRVVQPSVEIRSEITDVRLMLELPAASVIIAQASATEIAQIRAAAIAFNAGVEVLPFQEMRRLNQAFHRALIAPLRKRLRSLLEA